MSKKQNSGVLMMSILGLVASFWTHKGLTCTKQFYDIDTFHGDVQNLISNWLGYIDKGRKIDRANSSDKNASSRYKAVIALRYCESNIDLHLMMFRDFFSFVEYTKVLSIIHRRRSLAIVGHRQKKTSEK